MKIKGGILIVDDNPDILTALQLLLGEQFLNVHAEKNPNVIPALLRKESFDIILLDMNFSAGINSGNEGLYWMREIKKIDNTASIIFITAYGEVQLAVQAIREGATDFIEKPWDDEHLMAVLIKAMETRKSKVEVNNLKLKQKHFTEQSNYGYSFVTGVSKAMLEINKGIDKVAGTDANVLILGENGTGKEVIARELYRRSKRKDEVFIPVDLGSLSESLFESEMFGYMKGAFTDAKTDRAGWFEVASGGTLFLDEIGNLPLNLQSKLLYVIQNRLVNRLGSTRPISIDIRLISATNKNILTLTESNLFREDLLYRINTIVIQIPPLREREEDIPSLINEFLHKLRIKYNKPDLNIEGPAIKKLQQYNWPGNVRELYHVLEKATILCDSSTLQIHDFQFTNISGIEANSFNLEENEKQLIIRVLDKSRGSISDAAKMLGISRKTIYNKIKRYGL
jgi:two-component system, NtrC family, response regulator HydG